VGQDRRFDIVKDRLREVRIMVKGRREGTTKNLFQMVFGWKVWLFFSKSYYIFY
jgi:hypothetical protein